MTGFFTYIDPIFYYYFSLRSGFRGVSSTESAAIGGAAHLVNFRGGDTVAANVLLAYYYNSDPRVEGQEIGGYSVAASEHSTMTSWGPEAEYEAFKNMLLTWPTGPVACVSDSYNIWKACGVLRTKNGVPVTAHEEGSEWDFDTEEWGTGWASPELKALIMGRDAATGGRLIVRPDSGHPETVDLRILDILGDERSFGHTVNSKGFKVLPDQIRIIQGDGIDYLSIKKILDYLAANGWCVHSSLSLSRLLLLLSLQSTCTMHSLTYPPPPPPHTQHQLQVRGEHQLRLRRRPPAEDESRYTEVRVQVRCDHPRSGRSGPRGRGAEEPDLGQRQEVQGGAALRAQGEEPRPCRQGVARECW